MTDLAILMFLAMIIIFVSLSVRLHMRTRSWTNNSTGKSKSKSKVKYYKDDIESQTNMTDNHKLPRTNRPRAPTATSSILREEQRSSVEYGTCSPKKCVRFAEPDPIVANRSRSRSEVDRDRFIQEQRAAEDNERLLFAKLMEGSIHLPYSDNEEEIIAVQKRERERDLSTGTYLDEDAEIEATHVGLRKAGEDEWSEELRHV